MSTNHLKFGYIIAENFGSRVLYVCARPGWYYSARAGRPLREPGPIKGGPEHTKDRSWALVFRSHRAAARVANLCPGSRIEVVELTTK